MKLALLTFLQLTLIGCTQRPSNSNASAVEDITEASLQEDVLQHTILSFIDFAEKSFDCGSPTNFTDSCAFYFECDCCSAALLINGDSSFYYFNECVEDMIIRTGRISIDGNLVTLDFDSLCVSKIYRLDDAYDSSNKNFKLIDSLAQPIRIEYLPSKCGSKIKLIERSGSEIAIETISDYSQKVETLRKEGIIERLAKINSKL